MSEDSEMHEAMLRAALPWKSNAIVSLYGVSHGQGLLEESSSLLELLSESYRCFLHGFQRASIVLGYECVHRSLLLLLTHQVKKGRISKDTRLGVLDGETIRAKRQALMRLSYDELIEQIKNLKLLTNKQMCVLSDLKSVRNEAAHSEIPYVDLWPAGKRKSLDLCRLKPEQDALLILKELKQKNMQLRELEVEAGVYRIWIPHAKSRVGTRFIRIESKGSICKDLEQFDAREKCAALQFSLTEAFLMDVVRIIFGGQRPD